jgi:hypothetical protein
MVMVVAIVAVWVILSNGLLDDATKSGRIAVYPVGPVSPGLAVFSIRIGGEGKDARTMDLTTGMNHTFLRNAVVEFDERTPNARGTTLHF